MKGCARLADGSGEFRARMMSSEHTGWSMVLARAVTEGSSQPAEVLADPIRPLSRKCSYKSNRLRRSSKRWRV